MANDYDFVDDHVNLYVSDQNQRVIVYKKERAISREEEKNVKRNLNKL